MRPALALCLLVACAPVDPTAPGPRDPASAVCPPQPLPAPAADVTFAQDLTAFEGDPIPNPPDTFSMLLGDLDLDGDLDFVLNRHLRSPIELYANTDGRFQQLNPRAADTSGIYDNPGVPYLYAAQSTMEEEVTAHGGSGVFVWHDLDRTGAWRLVVVPDAYATPVPMRLVVNRPIQRVGGLQASEYAEVDDHTVDIALMDPSVRRSFSLDSELVGTMLRIELQGPNPPPMFAGETLAPLAGPSASLWKPDPHGLALVDAVGSPEPDLFVGRGALIGQLLPPQEAKTDQLFAYVDGDTLYEQVPAGVVPSSYARSRQVAWADVDGDGDDELYVSGTLTANMLLDDEGTGSFVDRAPELGLDAVEAESFAWTDVDGDGRLDAIVSDGVELWVLYQRDAGFEQVDGASVGLVSPADPEQAQGGIFHSATLHLVDVDSDGDLDLFVSNYDLTRQATLFLREGGGFADVGAAFGLTGHEDFFSLVPMDADNDGWMDVVGAHSEVALWRNQGGARLARHLLSEGFSAGAGGRIVGGDVDGDGWVDLVASTPASLQLLRNTTASGAEVLVVHPDLPLGSLVRAYYCDGRVQVQQWGATAVSRYNQSLQPLRFGRGAGVEIYALGVHVPGEAGEGLQIALDGDEEEVVVKGPR